MKPVFWSHAAAVNVETGLSGEGRRCRLVVEWSGHHLGIADTNCDHSCRTGIDVCMACDSFVWWRSKNIRLCWIWSFLMTGVWLAIAFVAQHEVGHNLY